MQVSQQDLDRAAERGVISPEQARALWHDLNSQLSNRPSFTANHVAYYLGALIVIGAMGWFMNRAWEQFGGLTLCLIAVVYGCVFFAFGSRLWQRVEFRIPAGLLITMAVCMAPLAVYGLERGFGLWPQSDPGIYRGFHEWIKGSWVFMEVATITAGAAALSRFRFPFITAPIAFSLWYLSMDIAPLLLGEHLSWRQQAKVTLVFGLVVLFATYFIDRRTKDDYAFWGYLFGALSFWGGLSSLDSNNEWSKFAYFLINLLLIFLSVLVKRRIFLVLGAVGVMGYFGHLAAVVFRDSWLFPFALSALGLAIMYLAYKYQRNSARIDAYFDSVFPPQWKQYLPRYR